MKKLFSLWMCLLMVTAMQAEVIASGKIIHKSGEDGIMGTAKIGEWSLNSAGELFVNMYGKGMKDYDESGGPWAAYADQITSIMVNANAIGEYAFANLPNVTKTDFTNVTSVRGDAFKGSFVPGHTVYMPLATDIGNRAFKGSNAGIIITPEAIRYGKEACAQSPFLYRVVCGDKIEEFDEMCFTYCPMMWADRLPNIILSNPNPPKFDTKLDKTTWQKFTGWVQNTFVDAYEFVGSVAANFFTVGAISAFGGIDIMYAATDDLDGHINGTAALFMPYTKNWRVGDEYENIFFPKPDNEIYTGEPVVAVPTELLETYINYYDKKGTHHSDGVYDGYVCEANKLKAGYLVAGGGLDVDNVPSIYGEKRGVWMISVASWDDSSWDAYPVSDAPHSRHTLFVSTPEDTPMASWSYTDGHPEWQRPWENMKNTISQVVFMSTSVPDSLFTNWPYLSYVILHPKTRRVGSAAFAGCTKTDFGPDGTLKLDSCKWVGHSAFRDCKNLYSTITIGRQASSKDWDAETVVREHAFAGTRITEANINANRIFASAFEGDKQLKEVKLYDVGELHTGVFRDCENLKEVNLGTRMHQMLSEVFAGCTKLEGGHLYTNQYFTPEATENTFKGLDRSKIKLHLPSEYIDEFDKDPVFHPMLKYSDLVFPIEGGYWYIDDSYALHITGNIPDFAKASEQPWAEYRRFIRNIYIEKDVTDIGNNGLCFPTGTSYVKSIFLNITVKRLGDYALAGHPNAVLYGYKNGNYYLGDGGLEVGEQGQLASTYANILGVEKFGNCVFQDWTALKKVYLASGVKEMGDYVFKNCPLQYVRVGYKPATITKNTFAGIADNGQDGLIEAEVKSNDYSLKWTYPVTTYWEDLHWVLPDVEIWFSDKLLGGNFVLTSDSVMHIWPADDATAICPYYEKEGLAAADQIIDWRQKKATSLYTDFGENDKVFDKVKRIEVTGRPTYLGGIGCFLTNLTEISIPESVTELCTSFYGCTKLYDVYLPMVEALGRTDRYGSTYHASGTPVTVRGVFAGCDNLKYVEMEKVNYVGAESFRDCHSLSDNVLFSNSLDTIYIDAFKNCSSLTYLVLKNVQEISIGAFAGCTNVVYADMGNNMPTTGMFAGCSNLKTVVLGDMIPWIYDNAFEGCPLEAIIVETPNPPAMGSLGNGKATDVFGSYGLGNINVYTYPDYVKHYEQAEGWKDMNILVHRDWEGVAKIPTGAYIKQKNDLPNIKWDVQDDGVLQFTAEGRMKEIVMDPHIRYLTEYVTHIQFNKGILECTPIAYTDGGVKYSTSVVYNARTQNIQKVTIPSTMQKMGPVLFGEAGVAIQNDKGSKHTITDVYCFAETPMDISYNETKAGSITLYTTAFGNRYVYDDPAEQAKLAEQRIPRLHVLHKDGVKTAYEAALGYNHAFVEILDDLTESGELYVPKQYTVTFVDMDDRWIETQVINEGDAATAPADPEQEGHTFKGWDKTFDNVTEDLTVKAIYNVLSYTVRFIDWDDKVLKSDEVPYGTAATPPADPEREGYIFKGWDISFKYITGETTVKAVYEARTYTVTFLDWDATELLKETVQEGGDAKGPETNPEREGYDFIGWSKPITGITGDLTVIAQYEKAKEHFTVTYLDWNGDELYKEDVIEGEDAKGPAADPARDGYTFTGWSKPLTRITADMTVVAQYEKKEATALDETDIRSSAPRKFLRNGVLLIDRNGILYDAHGHRLN